MTEIVVDTTPLQYLHQLGLLRLLDALFTRVIVPEGVAAELDVGRAAAADVPDVRRLGWVEVRLPRSLVHTFTDRLGRGEREVLALVLEIPGALAVLDDGEARREAMKLGLDLTGTVGILARARRAGLIESVKPLLDRLEELRFRLDPVTRRDALELAGELEPDA